MTTGIKCEDCHAFTSLKEGDYFVTTRCGHVFHFECIRAWIFENFKHPLCPSCRTRITLKSLIKLHTISPAEIISTIKLPNLKIILIGDTGTGKTSLQRQYAKGIFLSSDRSTVGCDLTFKNVEIAGKIITLRIWDTAGQERFGNLTPVYLRNANGVLLVYDITQTQTLEHVKDKWLQLAQTYVPPHVAMILVGNKTDLRDQREIPAERGQEVANELGIDFFETSAKEAYNVKAAFRTLAAEALDNLQRAGLAETLGLTDYVTLDEHETPGKKKSKCPC